MKVFKTPLIILLFGMCFIECSINHYERDSAELIGYCYDVRIGPPIVNNNSLHRPYMVIRFFSKEKLVLNGELLTHNKQIYWLSVEEYGLPIDWSIKEKVLVDTNYFRDSSNIYTEYAVTDIFETSCMIKIIKMKNRRMKDAYPYGLMTSVLIGLYKPNEKIAFVEMYREVK